VKTSVPLMVGQSTLEPYLPPAAQQSPGSVSSPAAGQPAHARADRAPNEYL